MGILFQYADAQSTFQQNEFIIGTICEPKLDSVYHGYPYHLFTDDITRYQKIKDAHLICCIAGIRK